MKNLLSTLLLVPLVGCTLPAQTYEPPVPPPPGTVVVAPRLFAPAQMDVLLGPIALYPDALIALILPASTDPSDIVLAARYLQSGGDPAQLDAQPWDDSVRALAHYGQVLRWMDENLAWTKQLGEAFSAQPADVMNAIQRLRSRASAAGTLSSTPQQQVVYDDGAITIVPTQPDVIYVPYYDPAIVYAPPPGYYYSPGSLFGFSAGFASGWWLSYGLDWGHHRVWTIDRDDRERYWREHRYDWHRSPPTSGRFSDRGAPVVRPWEAPQGRRPPGPYAAQHPQPGENRYQGHRDESGRYTDAQRNRYPQRPAAQPPPVVGPTAPAASAQTSAPTPVMAPPLPQSPSGTLQRYERSNSRAPAPASYPQSASMVGPVPMPPVSRQPTPPAVVAAPAPRPAPAIHMHAPAPQPAPQSQAQPAPQPQSSSGSSSSNSNDDDRRRSPYIRPR